MNRYPMWVNVLVLVVTLASVLLALPNFFGDDPALHVSRPDGAPVQAARLDEIRMKLESADIDTLSTEIDDSGAALIRFPTVAEQLRANDILQEAFPDNVIALTLAARTPAWLAAIGLKPMALGLDLRGGVHFLYQVDVDAAVEQLLEAYQSDLRTQLREAGIRNQVSVTGRGLSVALQDAADLDRAEQIIRTLDDTGQVTLADRLIVERTQINGRPGFRVTPTEELVRERQGFAIEQNIVTLRNRIDELGVAEPIVQRQGLDRILVELPGIQDPSQAERVLGATATLEFRLVDTTNDVFTAAREGRAPIGSELLPCADQIADSPYCAPGEGGRMTLLRREVIVSGDQLVDAISTYSQGQPAVSVRLSSQGGRRMLETTQENLNRPMAVLLVEETPEIVVRGGEEVIRTTTEERVISIATIRGVFSTNFEITGLTPFEAQDLALLLRSGALATPIFKVQERTIGPSLGQDNIERGRNAVIVGFLLVVGFMILIYRVFGVIADIALLMNLVMLVALMSLLQATLTLPGIAGIVLTLGMAVDANVLINERIREELKNGNSPQASIRAGYEKAFSSIADGNITTLIAGIVLFAFGTGPIKGFAVTLSLGIVTSMFTAIVGTRVIVNLIYGRRTQVKRLPIGIGAPHAAT
ncbi:MAG TPA: protein translocase subunit SecD [Gammaproteobacteria bacterium]